MSAIPEKRVFDAVIIPADLVRRWTEENEKWNRMYEALGDDREVPLCFIQGCENALQNNINAREEFEEQEAIRLGKNILPFPDLKKATREKKPRKRSGRPAIREEAAAAG